MNRLIVFAVLAAGLLGACIATPAAQEQTYDTAQAHRHAPQWFLNYWQKYLVHTDRRYGVLALDRKGRAATYRYCESRCHVLGGKQRQSWKDVEYKHKALEDCRNHLRSEFPAEKPDCAIYAVRDEIVWKGVLPWDASRGHTEARAATTRAAPGAQSQWTFTLSWTDSPDSYTGSMEVEVVRLGLGRMFTTLGGQRCEGEFRYTDARRGVWEIDCGGGWVTARGDFELVGNPMTGSRGTGVDNRGRRVEFVVRQASG